MNVLIVDKDKNFGNAVTRLLKKDKQVRYVKYFYKLEQTYSALKEPDKEYSIGIIDLDTIKGPEFLNNENTKYIVYSKDTKTIKKYLNNPFIQRVFQKPINLTNFSKYLNNYCGIQDGNNPKEDTILETLVKLGFMRGWIGTTYLAEAIELALDGYSKLPKDLYAKLAEKYKTIPNKIFWSINNSINRMVQSDFKEKHVDFFEIYDGRKPTPKFIIDFFVSKNGIKK